MHFWGSLMFMNLVFMPMFIQGMAGMLRRMSDGGAIYAAGVVDGAPSDGDWPEQHHLWGAALDAGVAQIPFIINFFWSIRHGAKVTSDNPWEATTLEWQTPTPPPHGNFAGTDRSTAVPYEYSVPGRPPTFTPQNEPIELTPDHPLDPLPNGDSLHGSNPARIPAFTTPSWASGCFLASEVMLFGGLFSAYILLRVGALAGTWPTGW